MIKNWKKFNENISADEETDMMKNDEIFSQREEEDIDDQENFKNPIGVNNMVEGINGLECIFSPLESDIVDDWNEDKKIQKWVEEERLFLQQIRYDEWSIWAKSGDKEVKNYIINNYSW
jgi:hypothetical protein